MNNEIDIVTKTELHIAIKNLEVFIMKWTFWMMLAGVVFGWALR